MSLVPQGATKRRKRKGFFKKVNLMPPVQCQNCGLVVQVPAGGRRLCGCGAWLSGEEAPVVEAVAAVAEEGEAPAGRAVAPDNWPRIESDLAAIERLNDGYRRIHKEISKIIV